MADQQSSSTAVSQPEYPPAWTPALFADGVSNFSNSYEIAKFYLFRFDPSITAVGPNKPQVSAQIVMSMTGFLQTAAFFSAAVQNLLDSGMVSKELWQSAQEGQKGVSFNA